MRWIFSAGGTIVNCRAGEYPVAGRE